MKRSFLIIAIVSIAGNVFANQKVSTQASDVTIFMNGAQVSRTKAVKLNQGKQTLEFVGLSPYIRDNSIQTGVEGKVTILGVKREFDFTETEKQNEKIESLNSQIKNKEKEISDLKIEQEVLKAEQDFLEANKVISGKNEATSLQNLQQTLNYYRERINAVKTRQAEITLALKDKNTELNNLRNELNQTQGVAAKETSKIIVEVNAPQAGTYKFRINYYVSNVSWSAAYDLRAFSVGEPMSLTYKAKIFQNTGEDWKSVNLTLSSGNPAQNNTKPSLYTYRLSEPVRYEYEYDAVEYAVAEEAAAPRMMKMSAKAYNTAAMADNMVVTEVSENLTAFEIKIKEKYDVLSSGEHTTVDVGVFDLTTTYEYHAIPKKDKDAFLIAKATDWTKHHLINGQANIYFENTYVGQTQINTKAANDTLSVSLGRDKSIVITREEQTDFSKKKMLSSKVEVTKAWEIQVKNQKRQAIDIFVFDQIPVSGSSSIEVSSELDGGSLKATTGEVTWKLNVQPNSTAKKTFNYKVKYPKDWNINIE